MTSNASDNKPSFHELAEGKRIVYLATRLYDYNQKLASLELEAAIHLGLLDASVELKVPLSVYPTFMPFRDTVENIKALSESISKEEKARSIYDDDLKRLSRLFALITYLNDPCKDDGICMEIGYAYANQVPILVVITDFISYSSIAAPQVKFVVDPILIRICKKIIHYSSIPPITKHKGSDNNYDAMQLGRLDFEARLRQANQHLYKEVRQQVKSLAINPASYVASPVNQDSMCEINRNDDNKPTVFIDFSGNKFEWSKKFTNLLSRQLLAKGMDVRLGKRHDKEFQLRLSKYYHPSCISYVLGDNDLIAALTADILVLSGDECEIDAGTAAIQGAARALGKPIVLYYSGNVQTEAPDRAPTSRNLMLLYSADRIATKLNEIPEMVSSLWTK